MDLFIMKRALLIADYVTWTLKNRFGKINSDQKITATPQSTTISHPTGNNKANVVNCCCVVERSTFFCR
jgi:hypothetical protein